MTTDFATARLNLARELAHRLVPTMPADFSTEADVTAWIERSVEWIFDDAAAHEIPLDETLVRATDRVLQELNEPLRAATGAPWPPSKVVPWPESKSAGVDTNRSPWADVRDEAIHFGYGEGETAALLFAPIRLSDLRG